MKSLLLPILAALIGASSLLANQPPQAKREPVKLALVGGDSITGTVSGVKDAQVSLITDYGVIRVPVERLTEESRKALEIPGAAAPDGDSSDNAGPKPDYDEPFWTMVGAVSTMIGSLVAGGAIVFAALQLRAQRLATMAESIIELDQRWRDDSLLKARRGVCNSFPDNKHYINMPEELVCGFFEGLGCLVRRGVIAKSLAWDYFSYYAQHYHHMLKPHISLLRKNSGDESYFKDFDYLISKFRQFEKGSLFTGRKNIPASLHMDSFIEGEKQTLEHWLQAAAAPSFPKIIKWGTIVSPQDGPGRRHGRYFGAITPEQVGLKGADN